MKVVAGIDGGQTSTVAVVLDATGAELGRGRSGPSDHVGEGIHSERAALACETAIARALAAAGLAADTALEAVVIALSGYEGTWHGREPHVAAAHVRYVHDAPAALAGAVGYRPAGVVIAGTGSVGYGETAAGECITVGGYGYLFGDAGSGFVIARDALAAAMFAADRGRKTNLGAAALAFFDVPDLRALVRAVALGLIPRPHIAAFSRLVLDAARFGDAEACGYVGDAATALAELADTVARRISEEEEPVPIALVGGVAENVLMANAVRDRLAGRSPATLVPAANDAAVGAALLAFDLTGSPRPTVPV